MYMRLTSNRYLCYSEHKLYDQSPNRLCNVHTHYSLSTLLFVGFSCADNSFNEFSDDFVPPDDHLFI